MMGRSRDAWPGPVISKSVMIPFMKFIQRCRIYYIKLGGVSGEGWLMNAFYTTQLNVKEGDGNKKTKLMSVCKETTNVMYLYS